MVWESFKKKYLGKISNIISWIFSIGGLVLAIVAVIQPAPSLGWSVVLSLVIFNSIFLVVISVYETIIFVKSKDITNNIMLKNDKKINALQKDIELRNKIIDKLTYYYKYIIISLNKFSTQLLSVNYKLQKSYNNIDELIKDYETQGKSIDGKTEEFIKNLKNTADHEYNTSMMKEFNHFLGNIIGKLKYILDLLLSAKGIELEVSLSIKQFSRIVTDVGNINDVNVITTFRDNQTYAQGKREIGSDIYTISKNTDFVHCLMHPYFLINNIDPKTNKAYYNEHIGFEEHYNCTIVAPIFCDYPDSIHMFGYLTCDVLNPDFSRTKILDEEMAEVVVSTANIIGQYFDNLDYQWQALVADDFLDIIYNEKLKQENMEEI